MPFSMTELRIDELQVGTSRQLPDDIGKNIPQQVDLAIFKANVCDARVSFDAITQPEIVGGKSKPSKLEDGALKPHQPWKRLFLKVARPKRRLSQDFVHHAQPTANGALPNSKDGGSGRPNQGFMEDPARQRTSPYKPPSVVNSDKNTEPEKPRSAPSLKGVTNDEQAEPASRSSAVQTSVVANQMSSLESVRKSPAILSADAQSSQLSRVGTKSSAVPSLGDVATDNTNLPSIEIEPIGKGSGEASTELEAHLKPAGKGKGREETHDRPKIPVEIPLSPRERVRNFSFKSSWFLQAEETDTSMSENEINQLGRFARLLNGAKSQKVLFGKPLPELSVRLVLINDGIEPAKKFICVTGLVEKAEISNFHTIMSQKRYRESYSDLWLCYETTKVSRAAGSLETYRLYPLDMDKSSTPGSLSTFCGVASEMTAASRNTSANVSWLSTLGGLICVDSNYYIITTAHRPEQNTNASTNEAEQSSPADTLVDEDFPDDVKPALVMVPEHLLQEPTNCFGNSELPAQLHSHLDTRKHLVFSPNGDVIEGSDWRLLPVNQSEILPNRLMPKSASSVLDYHEGIYIQSSTNTTSGRQVLINSGISGLVKGSVDRYSSFLIGDYSTPPEVERVALHNSSMYHPV
ncbi:hypothetical protein L207DRAFT_258992 [Hyaloscypha variabilis F]|uniref:Uncharacterized protein n=1 Tax=Hyaloscypha variabilis (strain UAMH 11265 / GT02V1 / F) TaxID=1149755 RepID=A0A2J6S4R6_HYAVF|nr:hypothetical protein L207DRAFT_258992 [Hyaloscypha variabilis F]